LPSFAPFFRKHFFFFSVSALKHPMFLQLDVLDYQFEKLLKKWKVAKAIVKLKKK
jgi:hypothetical protein